MTSYSYNPSNKRISETDALGHSTLYSYWNAGGKDKLAELTDAIGNTTTYVYDYMGRVTSEWDPLSNSKMYNHDPKGNLLARTDENGIWTAYAYDAESRLTDIWYHPEHPDATSVTFQYDARGKITHAANQNIAYNYSYDANGRVTSVSDSNGRTISYIYDAMGHRTQMTTPDGSVIQYGYDNVGRLTQIIPNGGQPFSFTYDAGGRRTLLTYPNDVTANYAYDQNRLISLTHSTTSGSVVDRFSYTLDNAGNRVAKADNEYQYSYAYDATYRVTQCLPTQAVQGPIFQQYSENFTYDAVGNRLTGPGYPKAVDGQDYTYDYENRLIRVINHRGTNIDTITFKYDPFGRRIEKNVETTENSIPTTYNYVYVYDNEDIIFEVLNKTQNGTTTTTTTRYVHGPGIDEPLSLARSSQTYYYHADGLGSVTSMTDSTQAVVNRYSYDSFGNVQRAEAVWNDFTYTGREYDSETGLYYLRARYYDSEVGKFVSKDPIGFAGGDVNVYNYTSGNPVNWVDPLGLLLSNQQIANIIFNETRSFSGQNISEARQYIAHAIINGDESLGDSRPITAPTIANVPPGEQSIYQNILNDVTSARDARSNGIDPTNGAMNFNFRNSDSTAPFYGLPVQTHVGPLNNSYTGGGLNSTGVWANTYGRCNKK